MAFQHHRWEKSGRLLRDDVDSTKFSWSSGVADDENVDLGDGTFAPYVWDDANKVASFGRSTLDLANGGLLKFLGIEKNNKLDYTLEGDFGSGFVDANMGGVPDLTVVEGDAELLIDLTFTNCEFRWQDVPGRTSQDGNMPVDFKTQLRIQPGNTLRLAQYITSPMAQDVRVRFEIRGLDPFSGTEDKRDRIGRKKNAQFNPADRENPLGYDTFVQGTEIGTMQILWSEPESDLRTITVSSQGQKRTLEVLMGPYAVTADEELIIFPDTYGATEVAVAGDDGADDGASSATWRSTTDGDGIGIFDTNPDMGGFRFTGLPANIESATSFDSGSYFEFDSNYSAGTGTVTLKGIEADLTSQSFSNSYIPSDQTLTTANDTYAHGDPEGEGGQFTSITGILDEMDTAGAITNSGAIGFGITGTTTIYIETVESHDGTWQPAQLKINYTVPSNPTITQDHARVRADDGAVTEPA